MRSTCGDRGRDICEETEEEDEMERAEGGREERESVLQTQEWKVTEYCRTLDTPTHLLVLREAGAVAQLVDLGVLLC